MLGSNIFSTLKQRFQLYLRIKKKQFNFYVSIKNLTKKIVFPIALLIIYLRDLYLCQRGKNILSVLYYHRVTNICQDGMTIGVEAFERQIRFLKKHYRILSASELEDWLNQNENYKGGKCVLITFDDGYEDNYLNALPILKKYSCPGIFFVSTACIGNDRQFEHDRELQPDLNFKKMDWEQLMNAMQHNIEIGIHSDTHLNLGKIPYQEGVHQIEKSIKIYGDNLRRKPIFMSYPFGGKNDITLKLVDYIKNHQTITALFSAYGNKNIGPIDRYNVKRINIGWKDKDLLTFWFKTEGGFQTLLYPYET